ncbi:MAG TPA: hypothetical protein VE690_01050, partial [Rhodopila sp.]|nr:hypothetical protein [Rhodopila sp.]
MATINWKSPTGGDWGTAAAWDTGVLPAAGDDVVIDAANPTAAYTVTVAAGETVTINSLTLNAPGDGTNQTPYVGA